MSGLSSTSMANTQVTSTSKANGHPKERLWKNFQSLKKLKGQSYTILMELWLHQSSIYPSLSWSNTQTTICNNILNSLPMSSTTHKTTIIISNLNRHKWSRKPSLQRQSQLNRWLIQKRQTKRKVKRKGRIKIKTGIRRRTSSKSNPNLQKMITSSQICWLKLKSWLKRCQVILRKLQKASVKKPSLLVVHFAIKRLYLTPVVHHTIKNVKSKFVAKSMAAERACAKTILPWLLETRINLMRWGNICATTALWVFKEDSVAFISALSFF